MPYPEMMVAPMRDDLVRVGFRELRTPADVEQAIESEQGTVLVVVNSICGCAAGSLRPAVAMALQGAVRPDALTTVFAGQDLEATERAREYFVGYPPSSPSLAIMRDGQLIYMMERHEIEGRSPYELADRLRTAFEENCGG